MEVLGGVSGAVGLAIPIFQNAKKLRDTFKQVASVKAELKIVLSEYEKEIGHLASLYNNHSALLDKHSLSADLVEIGIILTTLDESLRSAHSDFGKRKIPTFKDLWTAGDVREVIMAENAAIGRVSSRWQMRIQVCTLASTMSIDARLELQEGSLTEVKAILQQVLEMMGVLNQGHVRERARSLSVHPQIEREGFKSQTSVVANTTPSAVTFSIFSPSTALAYDRIRLRLEEYRRLLASDADTIELPTENGKIVICRKEASGMEPLLDQAESLLRDIVQSRDTSMSEILHRVRELAKVLDILKLGEECRLAGDNAVKLAVVLGKQSPEFRREQADTLAFIAGLSAYRPRACTLFSRAITICEEEVNKDPSVGSKMRLFTVLTRAGCWSQDHPDRGAQWLKRAVQLINAELPSTMVPPYLRSIIYNTYGKYLSELRQYADAVEAYRNAVSIQYTLVSNDPVKHTSSLVLSFMTMGKSHCNLGEYHDAIAAYKAAEDQCRAASAQDPLHYNALLAQILHQYGITLSNLNQVSEAAGVQKEAISHFRSTEDTTLLCSALHNYGTSCHNLGNHRAAVDAYTESIRLALSLADTDLATKLVYGFHNMANSLHALGDHDRAYAAASKALETNQWKVLQHCRYAPRFSSCYVCRGGIV